MNHTAGIKRMGNVISVSGNQVRSIHIRHMCAEIRDAIRENESICITLDFSECERINEAFMLPLLPIIANYQRENITFHLKLPERDGLYRLFLNTNWASHIDSRYTVNQPRSGYHVPALRFGDNGMETTDKILDLVMSLILGTLQADRSTLKAVEWSLGEVMDNVSNHAFSPVGGFVQATAYPRTNIVEFIVADGGIGIPQSMNIPDDAEALQSVINEGVTRDHVANAGNGLYGTYRVATLSNGNFDIHSLHGYLGIIGRDKTVVSQAEKLPYDGTSVRCGIRVDDNELLSRALRFNDVPHDPPYDYIERRFENYEGELIFKLKDQAVYSTSSREGGIRIRSALQNLLRNHHRVVLDFEGLAIVTSSFADEVFGRLFQEMGALTYMQKIEKRNVDPTVAKIIDRAITHRTKHRVDQRQIVQYREGEVLEGKIHNIKETFGFISVEKRANIFFRPSDLIVQNTWGVLNEGLHVSFGVRKMGPEDHRFRAVDVWARSEDGQPLHHKIFLECLVGEESNISILRKSRLAIVWTLFELEVMRSSIDESDETFRNLMQRYNIEDVDFSVSSIILLGLKDKFECIDNIIRSNSNVTFDDIGKIEKMILRLAVFEIIFGNEEYAKKPRAIVINEAIEIAKTLIGGNAYTFINGVLGNLHLEEEQTSDIYRVVEQVGGIVCRMGDVPMFSFVKDGSGVWTLSKGGLYDVETKEEGFSRVIKQEMNLRIDRVVEEIGRNTIESHPPNGLVQRKNVTYFLGFTSDLEINLEDKPGLMESRWFTYEDAQDIEFYPEMKMMILEAMRKIVSEKCNEGIVRRFQAWIVGLFR